MAFLGRENSDKKNIWSSKNKFQIINALKKNGMLLFKVDYKWRNIPEVVVYAINQNALAFAAVSENLKDDDGIIRIAVIKNGLMLLDASNRLKENREFVSLAIDTYPQIVNELDYTVDEDLIIKAVGINISGQMDVYSNLKKFWKVNKNVIKKEVEINLFVDNYNDFKKIVEEDDDFFIELFKINSNIIICYEKELTKEIIGKIVELDGLKKMRENLSNENILSYKKESLEEKYEFIKDWSERYDREERLNNLLNGEKSVSVKKAKI